MEDDTFDGVELQSQGYPEVDDWDAFGGTMVGNEHGSIMLYRRGTGAQREDLAVMFSKAGQRVGVHGLRLTGDTSDVHLELVCPGGAVVLERVALVPHEWYAALEDGIRAWRPGPDGVLEEFDPATRESSSGGC